MKNIYYELIDKYDALGYGGRKADDAILSECRDTELYTAINPYRQDVLECFPWDASQKVLCIGAVFGAYAGISERVARLDIADAADERLLLIEKRFPELMQSGRLKLMSAASDNDYDVVIADITAADIVWELNNDIAAFAGSACTHLKTGGSLIFIADNENTLRFKAGIEPEHPELLINQSFGAGLQEKCGFAGLKTFLPLPNAEFAKNIYSRGCYEPKQGSFKDIWDYSYEEKIAVFNEEALYGSLCESGCFAAFAPSYAFVYTGYHESEDKKQVSDTVSSHDNGQDAADITGSDQSAADISGQLPDYIRINRSRADQYALKTEIYKTGKKRFVRKSALDTDGNAHIESFARKYEIVRAELCGRAEAAVPHMGKSSAGIAYADFDYIEGRELGAVLAADIAGGRAPEDKIKAALKLILGDGDEGSRNIDALFENILINDDGRYCFIDYEWVMDEPVDRSFTVFRILSFWYDAYRTKLYAYADRKEFLESFGVDISRYEEFEEQEAKFQKLVAGDDHTAELHDSFKAEPFTPHHFREQNAHVRELTEWNLRLQDEIEEHKTALAKEREIERLSQNHIRNIERMNAAQKAELEILNAQNAYLAKHQDPLSKAVRRMIAAIDAWAPAESRKRKLIHYTKNTILHPGKQFKLYLTAEGRRYIRGDLNIGGEFAEGGLLKLPCSEAPLISIVIPAYNQVAYTYACIRSIIAETDNEQTPYEVILADDVSTDATAQIAEYIEGLVISRNSSNMGFLKNCNQAAAKARGRYILFLNNDTKVHKDWLSSLTELMEADESIGMAGSKLVYPDGRLQEAGGIIWSDASGWNYGRLDDPDKPEYNYVKDVDYISGAAIMIRTELWKEIGGFDEYFAPAYCEDSDLAFEVRRHGRRVVYQPKSVVTHFEGISNGTDVQGTGLKRYQVVNQEKFKTKWADELKKQSVNNGNPDPFTARDRTQHKPCVAIIDHYVPTWDKDAGSKTTYQYIRMFLKKGFNVKFIGDNFLHEEPYTSILQQLGVEVLYGEEYRDNIYEYLRKNSRNIGYCYLNRPHIAVKYIDFLKSNTDIKCIFYGHDLHYLRILREYELTGEIRKKRESDYWRSVEFSVMEQSDMVYYPSENEITEIHKFHPEISAKAITAYVWDEFKAGNTGAEDFGRKEGLLFVGGFKHPPNADAVKWFAGKIMPLIREKLPDIHFYVAGSGADEEVMSLNDSSKGVDILGFVSDERLEELYRTARLTVVPLRYGAGVKGKVVEAIYNNSVIVTTSVGAEGIPDAENVMQVVDDDPEALIKAPEQFEQAFADAVVKLYSDPARCAEMSNACTAYMQAHYSIDAAWKIIAEDFGQNE